MVSAPELLAPAGNLEKLKIVYDYGADAAYIGMQDFSLRSRADNFGPDTVAQLTQIKADKCLFGALNIYFHDSDMDLLEQEIDQIARYPFDALIVSDPGASVLLRKRMPSLPLHLSTQANCLNSESAKWYRDAGFSRLILGRELSLQQIERIREAVPDVELEVFIHGAMCWAYSGRCYLSSFLSSRSANKGNCSHPCRWEYRVLEEKKRPGEYLPIVEGNGYTTILSSKDLFMFDYIPRLVSIGIDSFKIEGRMKSLYYAGVVTRAYRKAIDAAMNISVSNLAGYRDEIFKVSHRQYSTGFFMGDPNAIKPNTGEYERNYLFLGTIGDRVADQTYRLNVKNQIRSGDAIEYIGPDTLFIDDNAFTLFNEDLQPVIKADHGGVFFLKTQKKVSPGYILRKVDQP